MSEEVQPDSISESTESSENSLAGLPNSSTVESTDVTREETTGQENTIESSEEKIKNQEDLTKLLLKVNGSEREYDLSDREALARDLQISLSANERFQQAAEERKQLEALQEQFHGFGEMLRSNPFGVLEQLGLNPREIAEAYLEEQYGFEDMPEQERALVERERALAAREAEYQQYQAQMQQQQEQLAQQQAEEQLFQGIIQAVEQSTLPKNEDTVRLMAKTMLENQIDDPAIALRLVEDQQQKLLQHYLKQNDPEKLASLLGDKGQEMVRKSLVDKVSTQPKSKPSSKNRNKAEEVYLSEAEARERLGL